MAAENRAEPKGWRDTIAPYVRPRPLAAFLLGISSGFPLTLLLSTMTLWLARVGIDKKTIGFAIGLTTPYTLKFLWAPLIDRTNLPLLTRWFGQRRSWLFLVQILLFGSVWMLGFSAPQQQHLNPFLFWAIATAFLAATQDIVIDAYRIEILSEAELPFGTANNQFGYRVGGLAAGVGTIGLASPQGLHLGWGLAYGLTGLCVLPGALAALWAGPGLHQRALAAEKDAHPTRNFGQWLDETIVGPFREFFTRNGITGASLILAFIVLYKVGDAMGQGMLNPMLVDLHFSDVEIVTVNKILGVSGVMLGIALAPPFMAWLGMSRALFLSGLLMMLTNFTYVILAQQGHSVPWLAVAVGTEQVASGIGSAVFVTYLSELSSVAYTATQYALLSSLAGIGRTWLSAPSGYAAKALGWPNFWLLAMAAALPGLGLLWLLWRRGFVVDAPRRQVTSET